MHFLIFILACLLSTLHAATYYVDMVNGSDSNSGTSDAAPWKHCPGQSTSPTRTINSGDTILFKRGIVHPMDAGIQTISGVTYDAYGSGANPILNGGNVLTYAFSNGGVKRNNITIQNLAIQNIGGWADDDPILLGTLVASIDPGTDVITTSEPHTYPIGTKLQATRDSRASSLVSGSGTGSAIYYVIEIPSPSSMKVSSTLGGASVDITTVHSGEWRLYIPVADTPSGTGISLTGGGDNILIQNVQISRVGQWRNAAPSNGINSITGTGIALENNNGVTIRNCNLEKMRTCISVKATTSGPIENILVEDTTITHTVWGIDMAPRAVGAVLQNVTFRGVDISNTSVYDKGNWKAFGEKPHTDMIFLRTADMTSTWTNVVIEKCRFYEDDVGASEGGTACIYISRGPSVIIRNCLFLNYAMTNGAIGFNGSRTVMYQEVQILNNTFVRGKAIAGFSTSGSSTGYPDKVVVKNNIFFYTGSTANANMITAHPPFIADLEWDNNIYWGLDATPETSPHFWSASFGYKNFAQWKSAYAAQNVDVNSVWINPLFTSRTGPASTWNLFPLPGSHAIGNGVNLSSIFTDDYNSATRPAVGAWDIGAYDTASPPPADMAAPTIVDAYTNDTGEFVTVIWNEPVQGVNLTHYGIAGHTLSDLQGSGTTWTFSLSPVRQLGADFSFTYTSGAGRTRDLADNLFASGTYSIRNLSLADTPDPPTPGRRGANKGKKGRR